MTTPAHTKHDHTCAYKTVTVWWTAKAVITPAHRQHTAMVWWTAMAVITPAQKKHHGLVDH